MYIIDVIKKASWCSHGSDLFESDAGSKTWYAKEVSYASKGDKKGIPSLSKIVYVVHKRVKAFDLGAKPPLACVQTSPLP